MNGRQWGAGLVAAGTMLVGLPAAGAQIERPSVVIRMYIATPLGTADWRGTIREASTILEDAGIEVGWINCSAPGAFGDSMQAPRCAEPLASNEVAVRIVRGPISASPHAVRPLGESLVDAARGTGTLATIYLDRVEWLAATGAATTSTVLARAIVHEVGHLLLGTATHSRHGLMRPVWTREELLRGRAADWTFPVEDAVRLRRGVERRIAAPPVPASTLAWSTH